MAFENNDGMAVLDFRRAVHDRTLMQIPTFTIRVLRDESWRHFKTNNTNFTNDTFVEFLTKKPLAGCGIDNIDLVEALVKKGAEIIGDDTAIVMFRSAVKGKLRTDAHRPKDDENKCSGEQLSDTAKIKRGDNNEYWQAVIERDRPELLSQIGVSGSARQIATSYGLRREASPLETLERAWRKASADEREIFLNSIGATL